MFIPLNKPTSALMYDLINLTNDTLFVPGDLIFSETTALDDPELPDFNSEVVVTGTGTTPFVGPQPVAYRRLDLTFLSAGRDMNFELVERPETYTLADILPLINARLELGLAVDDVIDVAVPPGQNQPMEITPIDNHPVYNNGMTITVSTVSAPVEEDDMYYKFLSPGTTAVEVGDGDMTLQVGSNCGYSFYVISSEVNDMTSRQGSDFTEINVISGELFSLGMGISDPADTGQSPNNQFGAYYRPALLEGEPLKLLDITPAMVSAKLGDRIEFTIPGNWVDTHFDNGLGEGDRGQLLVQLKIEIPSLGLTKPLWVSNVFDSPYVKPGT